MTWTEMCSYEDLVENSGVCALLHGRQVAIFLVELQGELQIYAVGNYDPLGGANVLSRGILGSVGEQIVVASPLYKQHFDLITGQCLEQPDVVIPVYGAKLQHGRVWLSAVTPQQVSAA